PRGRLGPDGPGREPALGGRRGQRELAVRRGYDSHRGAGWHIDRKGLAFEGTAPHADRAKILARDRDGGPAGEQDETLLAALFAPRERAAGSEREGLESHVAPSLAF